ncbi:MAG TPA: CvpA family protein [Blastocatellia bacterium]|nr:CvpA family protein [Blastocatellia bacterium]
MSVTDIAILFIMAISTLIGFARGLLRSTLTTAAALGGIVVAASHYPRLAGVVRPAFETDLVANLTAFLTIYLAVLVVAFVVSRLLRRTLEKARLGWLDSLGGAAFGLARGWVACSVAYLALLAFPLKTEIIHPSITKPYLERGVALLSQLITDELRQTLHPKESVPGKEPTHPSTQRKDARA